MTHYNTNHTPKASALRRALMLVVCIILSFTTTSLAQTIGGNVYGGGNQGDVGSSSTVELYGGTIQGNVYGGGNEADVKQYTSVTISGGELNNNVYGAGNQGNVTQSSTVTLKGGTIGGNVYGGACEANVGERTFVDVNATSTLIVKGVYGGNDVSGEIGHVAESNEMPFKPILTNIDKSWNSFIRVAQNSFPVIIGTLYGGGNGAYSDDIYSNEKKRPELGKTYIELSGGIYGYIYGGGNMATVGDNTTIYMDNKSDLTVPSSFIESLTNHGIIYDYKTNGDNTTFSHHVSRMFGGNNQVEMSIRPQWNLIAGSINDLYSGGNKGAMTAPNGILLPLTSAGLTVNNVYGGCRMADVNPGPTAPGEDKTSIQGVTFPAGYATRVYITAGNITNVYGGNDISGKVNHGTNLKIFSNISGDVYGGGNGSYAYTDNQEWVAKHPEDADYYYNPNGNSINALFNFRPHIEKTLIHIAGNNASEPVNIGSVYCGGNSATLYKEDSNTAATFQIGKNVKIGNVFLGSNGENMLSHEMSLKYARKDNSTKFSNIIFESGTIKRYMDGVVVNIVPTIEWDKELDYSTTIGSFYCGGNVGSMTYDGVAKTGNNNLMIFPAGITITDKIVAGCNKASIIQNGNVIYEGGLVGAPDDGDDKVRIRVLSRLSPAIKRDRVSYQDADGVLQQGKQVYQGANVYGGCYESGIVNGNVVIDIESDIIAPDLKDEILTASSDYLNASTLAIYGGGYGSGTAIKGNTTINLTGNARILKVFGGGEMGSVTRNTTINLDPNLVFAENTPNAYKVYAGGFEGDVAGNTTLNLLGGSVMSAFAGACNANIGGATKVIIGAGTPGKPYVVNAVYGGNDFGGEIEGNNLYSATVSYGDKTLIKNVRSQTYVEYNSGKIGRAIYGGSYGSYDYTKKIDGKPLYNLNAHVWPTIKGTVNAIRDDLNGTILTNTFVNIASQSRSAEDVIGSDNAEDILTMIAGGGRGYKGLPEYVEVGQTYLLLHGATNANRNGSLMAHRVYGGGNLSKVGNTRIDAYSGSYGQIFGGTHGVRTENADDLAKYYDCENTGINYYGSMDNANMNIYGAGANSGATDMAAINLYGGVVNNVYGGSLAEGYTANTSVNVPAGSAIKANAIFGGARGEENGEGRPCDVGSSSVMFASTTATVEDGIYGGNHTARATKQTNVTISVPVKNQSGNLQAIYGAGYGEHTVAGFTHVILNDGAKVARVYGGGREGKVYNHYKYSTIDGYSNNERQATWTTTEDAYNTLIDIHGSSARIAHVTENVYGAGYGTAAHTSGKTKVQLLGGTVDGDIYGGGEKGTMPRMDNNTNGSISNELEGQVISALCTINGGQVRNVFGGGYQGNIDGNSGVDIGSKTGTSFYAGIPTILRSAYGGGEMAKVSGTSTVNMYNGYIGYRYDAEDSSKPYKPELKLNADDEANLLKENGNLYGAGYGEGAVVMKTQVNLYDGIIRNGLYGGGEIAAVGDGTYDKTTQKYTIAKGGQTNVRMYGGLVEGDVFGGGRGFSYDFTGNQVIGKTLYSDGYVFGKTNVEIYRGTIGTDASLAEGHGNVFGGGNIGYVYSAGQKYTDPTSGTMINGHYYFTGDDPDTKDITETTSHRTEDCRVHISVSCLVTAEDGVTISNNKADKHFDKGEYVPTEYLNTLPAGDERWKSLNDDGITIRNAVFAGGNVSAGSDLVYANAVTVYGNATASVIDAFSRDLVILGGEHIGGLYGDGNLTFVDGYRELNITNYGTDYYHLKNKEYNSITSERERAYYMYDNTNNRWIINSTSGRTMNTIQRADFCGVFGCRILLHGAQDRVPDVVDYTNYTINRVNEVSLNCVQQGIETHGNYFGIYNVVNLLGAFTSDVEFSDIRIAESGKEYDDDANCNYGTAKYSDFKSHYLNSDYRNNGKSHNMVALASGVYLELVKEYDSQGNKIYGPVTGVIELDLINVVTGEGGGYVYAKNEHGEANSISEQQKKHLTLSDANKGAITQAAYTYKPSNAQSLMQTSGNFVHPEKRIGDDCFPKGGDYSAPVHFWYVCGTSYVYDQHISAYTGAARPYDQSINIPLTIANGSDGKIKLLRITLNKYYTGNTALKYGNKTYLPYDPITLKEYNELPTDLQNQFTDALYVAQCDVWTDGSKYSVNDKISKEQYESLVTLYSDASKTTAISKEDAFCIGNEMSHENGYMLTFEMSNPKVWGTYYTEINDVDNDIDKKKEEEYLELNDNEKKAYIKAPTIRCNSSGIYGQQSYLVDELVSQTIITRQDAIAKSNDPDIKEAYNAISSTQAEFGSAYIAIKNDYIDGITYVAGNYISESLYDSDIYKSHRESFENAYICINTIEVADKDFILPGDLISSTRYELLDSKTSIDSGDSYMVGKSITDYFSPAYVCTKEGKFGGTYFKAGQNYDALDICELPKSERNKIVNKTLAFEFNHDALDLFDTYEAPYDQEQYVDFTAAYEYTGDTKILYSKVYDDNGTYTGEVAEKKINSGDILQREDFQLLLNEQAHYIPIDLVVGDNYIVKKEITIDNKLYPIGQALDNTTYSKLSDEQKSAYVTTINVQATEKRYICFERYCKAVINSSGTSAQTDTEKDVIEGTIITKNDFESLPNSQEDFAVTGIAAIETSTLFVPRESDIRNLAADRIISVELEYRYKDRRPDYSFEEKVEKHIVNIHIQFKSGQPSIGEVIAPAVVLPNTTVGLTVPTIIPGAYEIIGGGWEIFKNETDAKNHKNGEPYINNATPMYWYQNDYYVAYFAKTYLGKAYSNPVPFTIANFHRMSEVMNHPEYMYIDHEDASRYRAPKIYLDAAGSENASKNDLDYLADLLQVTYKVNSKDVTDPETNETTTITTNEVDERIKGCANLEFILRSDISPKKYTDWTSIASDKDECFAGTLHGNGYTISGLNNSLFGNLCGKVYNLGVTGSFAGGGIADNGTCPLKQHTTTSGYAENCWVYTTGTPTANTKAIIGTGGTIENCYYHANNSFAEGNAIKKDASAFERGEVTYLLNGFYKQGGKNKFYRLDIADNVLKPETNLEAKGYVENFYTDGDFIYANGEIPLENNERYDNATKMHYPIYPDDYLFFGQRLTYDNNTHNHVPTRIDKVNDRVIRTNSSDRVFCTSAYYSSKNEQDVYFNTNAKFVDSYNYNGVSIPIHHNLTAIDFTSSKKDYENIVGFSFDGLTRNMLVYTDGSITVINKYLEEAELKMTHAVYQTVNPYSAEAVRGHLVTKQENGSYVAESDHFLVDGENFNAPIEYQYADNCFMWYQRTPDKFAESGSNGWDVICLPFTAGLVTTHQKGEITHFYDNSKKMHEYWLREFNSVTTDAGNTKAVFASPKEDKKSSYKAVNKFLYDYYYSKSNDKNTDTYQDYYSAKEREYDNYAYLTAATPYIVAFPGATYKEFDMSGEFEPQNTATHIAKLDKQVVTMVSTNKAVIAVTDDKNLVKKVNGYQFVGTYQAKDINGYLMNADGSAFEATNSTTVPFRGYLLAPSSPAPPKRIFIGGKNEDIEEPMEEIANRGLTIYGKKEAIYIESTLEHETTVIIYGLSGQVVARVKVQPMSKEVVTVPSRGVYIVNNRKVAVL